MQALRDFWARNTLNKLIIVAVVGLLCCCPLAVTGRGGRGAATAPTSAPAAAAATEAPTAAPAPTEPPTPTAEPTGLGVRPEELRRTFSGLGFRFEDNALRDGTPRLLGRGPQDTSIELIGPPEGLTTVSVLAGIPTNDNEAAETIATYIGTVLLAVAPEHQQEIADWFVEQLRATVRGEDVTGRTLDTGDVQSTVTTLPANNGIVITYSISSR